MNIDEKIIAYAKNKGVVSIPQIQRDLDLTYSQARSTVARLDREYYFKFDGGTNYLYCGDFPHSKELSKDALSDGFLALSIDAKDIIVDVVRRHRPILSPVELILSIRRAMRNDDDDEYDESDYLSAIDFVDKTGQRKLEQIIGAIERRLDSM